MHIEHLQYVLEIERAGSISQAADNLFMGQPNLSKAIKEMEETLQITLFTRTSKGVQITPKGRQFLRYAKSILRQYEQMEALGKEDRGGMQSLRVSVPRASYIVNAFTTLLAELDAQKPMQMDFLETNALCAIQHVSDGVSDLGVIRCKAEYQQYFIRSLGDNGLVWQTLLAFEYQLLLATGHPLAEKAVIDERELHPYTEIIHGDTALPHMSEMAPETERGVTPGNRKVQVYERGSQFDILARVPGTYMWVSPMPSDLLERNDLQQKACKQSPAFTDILIWRAGHVCSDMETRFIDRLHASAAAILTERAGNGG